MPEELSYLLQRVADMLKASALSNDPAVKAEYAYLAEEFGDLAGQVKRLSERSRKPI